MACWLFGGRSDDQQYGVLRSHLPGLAGGVAAATFRTDEELPSFSKDQGSIDNSLCISIIQKHSVRRAIDPYSRLRKRSLCELFGVVRVVGVVAGLFIVRR